MSSSSTMQVWIKDHGRNLSQIVNHLKNHFVHQEPMSKTSFTIALLLYAEIMQSDWLKEGT